MPASCRTSCRETKAVRESDWTVAPIPADLQDRRVEITGPTDRKMIINALNSGAKVFMADCEDSLSPTWENVVGGQLNLRDAVRREIELVQDTGKVYRLNSQTAVLIVRPRGWHLYEKHITQRWPADSGRVRGLRALPLPQREGAAVARHRAVFLPAEAREPPRGAPVGRSVRVRRRAPRARRTAPSR